jgi:hypothetical protein
MTGIVERVNFFCFLAFVRVLFENRKSMLMGGWGVVRGPSLDRLHPPPTAERLLFPNKKKILNNGTKKFCPTE